VQSSGTYTEISGGTVLGNTASDDQYFVNPADPLGTAGLTTGVGFPIGFNFTFNGIVFDRFAVNNNGWIGLGQSALTPSTSLATTSAYTPLSSTAVNTPAILRNRIAGMGRDIQAQAGSELRFETIGSAPNRKLVVQYKNYKRFGAGFVGDNFNFQIVLNETTNFVQVIFGAYVFNTVNTTSTVDHIGLGGTLFTDFNNRRTAVPHDWNATLAGITNADGCQNATSTIAVTVPAPGLTFTWLPPPPCVPGSLAGGTTQSTVASACAATPFDLSVTGASFGTGLTYQWESSLTGLPGSFAIIGGATTATYTVPNQTAATYYHRKMTCSGTDAFSTDLLVGQNTPANCYCTVTFPSNVEPITLVNFSNINNATSATLNGTPALENFTAIVGNVAKGQSYPMTVKGNTDGNFTTRIDVYIDWNQNGSLTDPGESYFIGTIVNSTGVDAIQASASIPIPATALDGNTRMRVMKKFNTSALPCNNAGFGQAEDYTLNISTPLCLAPSGVSVGSITANSAVVTFTSAGGTTYVEYGLAGFTPGTGAAAGAGGTVITPAVSPQAIGGLAANTLYDVYVRRDCGGGIFSSNTASGSFRTLCNAVTTFPYTETFEAASPTRPCWSPTIVSGTVNWTYGAGAGNGGNITTAHGGAVNARHFGANSGSVAKLVSPSLNFSAMPAQGAQVTFWYANQNWLGDQNQLRVYYKTSAAGAWTLIPGAVYTTDVGVWTEVELVLPSSSGPSDYYIAFEGTELFGWGVAVDDVTIAVAPTCPKPTAVSAIGVSPTSVMVNFTSPGTAFIVEYGPVGFTPGIGATAGVGGTLVLGAGSPITVTGLTPNTTYDFYVRRICIPGVDFSVNTKIAATTLCNAVNIPYLQNFESSVVPAPPTCTSVQDLNGNSGSVPNAGGGSWFTYDGTGNAQTYVSPTKTIRYLYDATNALRPADDWFYTQGLNLTGGINYRLKFFIKGSDGPTWIESLEVKYGTLAHSSAMSNLLYTNNNIATALANPWDSVVVDFAPATTGVYYIGFHAISLADQAFLYLDDVSVKLAPLVDVGISGITVPSLNCPTNNVFVQATVRNYNTTAVNFATYPVTVTANITGAATGTLTALLNTGTLAPGASMGIYLSPSFNFSVGGTYTINVATSSPVDPETGNDAFTTSVIVNPNPPVPVITPANPAVCAGTPVQLSTQFTASPPPVSVPVSSGIIAINIPDNIPAGTSHTIAVSSIPAGASITGVSVTIDKIAHTFDGDLIINLRAPNNKVLNLFNQRGLGGDSLISTVITSATGAASLATGAAPFTGTYAPDGIALNPPTGFDQTVTTFPLLYAGLSGNGNWTLAVRDNAGLDVGILRGWTITITYQILTPTITWTPTAGLYTNAGATTAYAGGNAFSLYANPPATSTYTVTATTAAGCTSSATTTVTVNPLPVITIGSIPDTVCISDQLIPLPASPVGGSWSGVGVSGTNFVPPATAVGTYILTYTYTSTAGCTVTATKKISVKDCPERIILLRDNALILYPNPNSGLFNIRVNSVLYNNLVMKVYASNGVLVRTQQLGGLTWGRVVSIDLTNLPGGVYMVKFYYDGGVRTAEKTFKVIIGHE
jgi:subtilisin-like proprotein convertase family protein